jgi:hypothetical protein
MFIDDSEVKITVVDRTDFGTPLHGTALFRRQTFNWKIDGQHARGIILTQDGNGIHNSTLFSLETAVKNGVRRHENGLLNAERRQKEHQKDWPMYPMPKVGHVRSFGHNQKRSYTLPPEEHAFAMDLREAARSGQDFASMIASIEKDGFLIRPVISHKPKDDLYRLSGFRFCRDGIEMQGSLAKISIIEDASNPRAPVLPRDGDWLMNKKKDYDEAMAPVAKEISDLDEEIRGLMKEGTSRKVRAALLLDAGIEATFKQDDLSHLGDTYRRTRYFLSRDDVTVKVVTPWDPDLAWACREMIRTAKESEIEEPEVVEPGF